MKVNKDPRDLMGSPSLKTVIILVLTIEFRLGQNRKVSNEKNAGCLVYIGDYTTQLCGDYFIYHYKDPYSTTSIVESKAGFCLWLKYNYLKG